MAEKSQNLAGTSRDRWDGERTVGGTVCGTRPGVARRKWAKLVGSDQSQHRGPSRPRACHSYEAEGRKVQRVREHTSKPYQSGTRYLSGSFQLGS